MTETFQHYTVMLKETVDGLNIKPDGVYVDCTLGGAGHSEYLLSQLSSKGHLYAFDQDQKAIDHAKLRLASYVEQGMVTFIKANFRELEERLSEHVDKVDGILYDLGVSSPQLDEAERGFSYHQDAPLDMRMDQSAPLSAYHVINEYSYHELVKIFSAMARRNFPNKLLVKSNEYEKQNQSKQLVSLSKSLNKSSQLPQEEKAGILQKEFFKLCGLQ